VTIAAYPAMRQQFSIVHYLRRAGQVQLAQSLTSPVWQCRSAFCIERLVGPLRSHGI
jgi:hypothetical protein